ncbi:MAG TPA: tRNA glutamyl-Q(34) synthetase GluQRS [Bacillales bacterium]|nr:tRNA glutamyl-Q(34) synthetase GluQRS [Bacillales bacterium]
MSTKKRLIIGTELKRESFVPKQGVEDLIRGRFAPTPSGELHIGNALAALLAWLQIREANGEFILRMENLDQPRSRPEYARQILDDLRWLGIDWDEGPDVGGPYGPYNQSERGYLYKKTMDRLKKQDRVYPCFCSRKELRGIASAPHGRQPIYPGICRGLTVEEQAAKRKVKDPSFRFKIPEESVSFNDGVHGELQFPSGYGGDFVVKRADGIISYQLAVVADDAAMKITHVLRGADLLESTPKQIFLYRALGFAAPEFSHVPLIYGPDGKRLSKRHGSAITLSAIRKAGTKPEWLIGRLVALAGLINRPEPIKAAELIGEFQLSSVSGKPMRISDEWLSACVT